MQIYDGHKRRDTKRFDKQDETIKALSDFMTQLVKNIDKRLDDRDVMVENKLKLFREESNQIMSDKIRETEEQFGFINNVLDEKVNKNRGDLTDIVDYEYKQRLEEASNDLRASMNAIDEKTEASLKLMNRQIEINEERVENKLGKMKLYNENPRDHAVKSLIII